MEISFVYTKRRAEFGKHTEYTYTGPQLLIDIRENPSLDIQWVEPENYNDNTQIEPLYTEHSINTHRIELTTVGMQHLEGGWPKEIDSSDTEHVTRYRKKVERDANFQMCIRDAAERAISVCMLNNTFDYTMEYFASNGISIVESLSPPSLKILAVFKDPNPIKRAIRMISWAPSSTTKAARRVAVAYCTMEFQHELFIAESLGVDNPHLSTSSYIWDIENPANPETELRSSSPVTCIRYSQKDSHVIIGGLYNGCVCYWDIRGDPNATNSDGTNKWNGNPLSVSKQETSHSDPVTDIRWVKSKTGTECCSVSTDSRCFWWDTRKIDTALGKESIVLTKDMLLGGRVKGGRISRPSSSFGETRDENNVDTDVKLSQVASKLKKEEKKNSVQKNSSIVNVSNEDNNDNEEENIKQSCDNSSTSSMRTIGSGSLGSQQQQQQKQSRPPSPNSLTIMSRTGMSPSDHPVGITCLNYDPAGGLTKFLIGTETGHILVCSSKGDLISSVSIAHCGMVRRIDRNAFNTRYFISCGDTTLKLWNDEVIAPLLTNSASGNACYTDCAFSPARPGVIVCSRSDGFIDVYDVTTNLSSPILSMKVSDFSLTCIEYDTTGKFLAVGIMDGTVLILEVSDYLFQQQPMEKQLVQAIFERELKREKNLEYRSKEMKLKRKKNRVQKNVIEDVDVEIMKNIEKDFFESIEATSSFV